MKSRDYAPSWTYNDYIDSNNERSILCYRKVLINFPIGNCTFNHMVGSKYPQCFVQKLCEVIAPELTKIIDKGELLGGMSKKRSQYGRGGGADASK